MRDWDSLFSINSKILGHEITFSCMPSGYIFVDINGQSGTLGKQICRGDDGSNGCEMGNCIQYKGANTNQFRDICRNWYRAYCKRVNKYEIKKRVSKEEWALVDEAEAELARQNADRSRRTENPNW